MHYYIFNKLSLITLLFAGSLTITNLFAQESLKGRWIAPDEKSNGVTSVVELYQTNEQLHGRILSTLNAEGREIYPVCENCSGILRGSQLKGMTFITGLVQGQDGWTDGQVIDLRPGLMQGMKASCEISLVNGKAVILGYFISRKWGQSSTWVRF